jgi:hypothetical protein
MSTVLIVAIAVRATGRDYLEAEREEVAADSHRQNSDR